MTIKDSALVHICFIYPLYYVFYGRVEHWCLYPATLVSSVTLLKNSVVQQQHISVTLETTHLPPAFLGPIITHRASNSITST